MLLEIIIFLFYTFFCLFSVIGYGIIFNKLIFNPVEKNIGETAFFGFLLLFLINLLFHFFIPLSYWLNFIILLLGFSISFNNLNYIKNEILESKKYLFLITIIILPSILIFDKHADYDWYHLPYVNYLNNFKIVFGLVNVSNNYTYGHGWMDIMGSFSLPLVETKGLSIISLIFFYFFLIYLLIEIRKTKLKSIKIYSIILIIYSFANFNKLVDFEAEIQPTIILFILILNVLKMMNKEDNIELLIKTILYFFFAILFRIGSIIILPFILIIIFLNFKKISKSIKNYLRLHCFLTVFLICFLLKNLIVTGCLSYPIPWTCFNSDLVAWANPIENVKERFEYLSATSKRWKFYYMEKANLDNRFEYFEPMTKGIILDPKSYNENKFFWLKYWSKDHDIARLFNSIIIITFCFICFLIFSKNKFKAFKALYLVPKKNNLIHIGIVSSILMWLFLSPQMRYGGHPIVGGTLIFYSSLIISKFTISKKKFNYVAIVLLLISISYFVSKNVTRVVKILSDNKFTNFPWPEYTSKILGKDYREITINGIKLNLILTSDNMVKGEPMMCGNVDMLCLPHERIVCISDINHKNGYIFIENNNPKCLTQFRQNYWQH